MPGVGGSRVRSGDDEGPLPLAAGRLAPAAPAMPRPLSGDEQNQESYKLVEFDESPDTFV